MLLLFLFFINFCFALDECKSSTLTYEDVPCLVLYPVTYGFNCSLTNFSVYLGSNIIYTQKLSNYSYGVCNGTFTPTNAGTYNLIFGNNIDHATFTIGVGTMNLLIGAFFLAVIFTLIWLMHKTRDVEGSSFIYSGFAGVISLIFSLMLFTQFKLITGITFLFDINYYFAVIMLGFAIYCFVVTNNLMLDYRKRKVESGE